MVIPSFEWQLFQDSCDYLVIVTYIAVLLKSNTHLTRTPIGDTYRKFGLKPRRFTTALSYNGKSDNQAKN